MLQQDMGSEQDVGGPHEPPSPPTGIRREQSSVLRQSIGLRMQRQLDRLLCQEFSVPELALILGT